MARKKKPLKKVESTPLFGDLPVPAPPPAAAPMPGPPVHPAPPAAAEPTPTLPSREERQEDGFRPRPLAGVSWLLGEPKKKPEWQPGQLALHVVPVTKLAGSTVAVWQVRRLEFDIHNHRLLVLGRACAPSSYPLLERWIPLNEMVLLKVSAPLEWEPLIPGETPVGMRMPPGAAEASGFEALLAYRKELLLGPAQIDNRPLRRLWGTLEALAVGLPSLDDPVASLMERLGLDDPPPVELGEFRHWLVQKLSELGAKQESVRRLLIECGLAGNEIHPLTAAIA